MHKGLYILLAIVSLVAIVAGGFTGLLDRHLAYVLFFFLPPALFFIGRFGFLRFLDHLEEWFIVWLMGAATAIIFLAVLQRNGASRPIPYLQDWLVGINMNWAQELCIILFIWMAKFGAAYGVRTGIHVGVDVLINRLGDGKRRVFILFGMLAGALFTFLVGTLGWKFVWDNGLHYVAFKSLHLGTEGLFEGPTTPDLELPTWIEYLAIPLGSYLMCFRFLQVSWVFQKTGQLPHHDPGHVAGLEPEADFVAKEATSWTGSKVELYPHNPHDHQPRDTHKP